MPGSGGASASTYTSMMRVTTKGRPFAKDLFDIFSAMLIQQPLTDHKSLFRTYPSTFTTDEIVENLSHLQFTHLVPTPNPEDPSQPLMTRTTTTFSMSSAMAKNLGKHFLNARLVENAVDPQNRSMKDRGIYSPTPKGKFMVQEFSQRASVSIRHLHAPLSLVQSFRIVHFERLPDDDQLSFSRANMTHAFKVMLDWLPTDTMMLDDMGGTGMETNIEYEYTFYGYQCFEWINEYSTVLSPEEALMVASEFILYGWIQQVTLKNEIVNNSDDNTVTFRYGKKTIYYLTQRGRAAIGLSNGNDAASIYGQSQMGNFSERSSTHSSASGSSTTIQSTTKAPSIKTQKQNHAKRLLPTTSSTEKSTVPKATVTEKTDVPTPTNEKSKSSLINMDSRCDFGFRPPLNKDSTSDAVVAKNNNNKANDIVAEEEYDDEHITEELLQLKISEKLNSKVPGSNTSQISSVASTITSLDDQDSSSSVSNETDTDEINKNLHFISQNIPQSAKLQAILEDPLLRMYFRQYLRTNYCEENINFWTDYRVLRKKIALETSEITEELCNSLLFECGVIYYNYLCEESSPVELNIDHTLRLEISYFMKALFAAMGPKNISHSMNNLPGQINEDMPFGSISASPSVVPIIDLVSSTMHKHHPGLLKNSKLNPYKCLKKSLYLFDKVNNHVIRMMAQDSIPRFIKSEKYQELLELHTGNKEQNNIICPTSLQRAKPPKSSNHLND